MADTAPTTGLGRYFAADHGPGEIEGVRYCVHDNEMCDVVARCKDRVSADLVATALEALESSPSVQHLRAELAKADALARVQFEAIAAANRERDEALESARRAAALVEAAGGKLLERDRITAQIAAHSLGHAAVGCTSCKRLLAELGAAHGG